MVCLTIAREAALHAIFNLTIEKRGDVVNTGRDFTVNSTSLKSCLNFRFYHCIRWITFIAKYNILDSNPDFFKS